MDKMMAREGDVYWIFTRCILIRLVTAYCIPSITLGQCCSSFLVGGKRVVFLKQLPFLLLIRLVTAYCIPLVYLLWPASFNLCPFLLSIWSIHYFCHLTCSCFVNDPSRPFKNNGVPLTRVNQSYVIGTPIKVEPSGVSQDKLNDVL